MDRKEPLKEFTYEECIKFSGAKSFAIEALQKRLDRYFTLVEAYVERQEKVDAHSLLREFTRIDFLFPLYRIED